MPVSSSGDAGSNPAPASIILVGGVVTRFSVRCMILVLTLTCCCAFFTVVASAVDPPTQAGAVVDLSSPEKSISVYSTTPHTDSVTQNWNRYGINCYVTASAPSAGILVFDLVCPDTPVVPTSIVGPCVVGLTGNTLRFTCSFTDTALVAQVSSWEINYSGSIENWTYTLNFVSWTPSGSGGGEGGGGEPSNPYPSSGSRWILTDNKGNWVAGEQGQQFLSTSNEWQTMGQYIGDYVTKVKYSRDGAESEENSEAFMSRMLSNLAYSTWDWSVSDGKLIFFPPENAEGSWLDNLWRMNVTIYYNLVNNSGWFGNVTSNQSSMISLLDTLNTRVLQILSVLANDEDVKIKDATTPERTWIQNYFEGDDPVGPSAGNFTDLRSGFGSITDQFETDKSITDIGSVFSDSAYDSRSQFFFWSQTVSDDVNGVSRGGFGGGKAPARAPAVSDSTFSDQYEYGDDSIVDAFDFIGGASDG